MRGMLAGLIFAFANVLVVMLMMVVLCLRVWIEGGRPLHFGDAEDVDLSEILWS